MKMPAPCRVIAALPLSALWVTPVRTSVSAGVGSPERLPFQIPAPSATPLCPFATARFA